MPRVSVHLDVDDATLAELIEPRDDWVVAEATPVEGDDEWRFQHAQGPFRSWERVVRVEGDQATETIEFALATPGFARPFGWLYAWALRRRLESPPFWAPPQRFDEKAARVFPLLVVATMAAAYMGTLLSQSITFVADEFNADRSTQGLVTALTRVGAILALIVVFVADRIGRRRMLLAAGTGAAVFAALAALSPNIWFFGGTELVSRGLTTGMGLLIGIFAAEESPAGSRAWITSVLALFAGLGSGMVLWLVPLAGSDVLGTVTCEAEADGCSQSWRILFIVALLVLPVLWGLARRLPESRRFTALAERAEAPAAITAKMRRRFGMLSVVFFANSFFGAPSSNFQNEYLRDERGFSPTRISLFSTVTSTPIGIGVAIFGPLADKRGRRLIGAFGIFTGVVFNVVRYGFGGPLMWIAGTASTILGAAAIPALGVYGPEMFPTSRRGLANGLLTCVAVVGSVLGLTLVGQLADRWSFGQTFAVVAIVPLVAMLMLIKFPETARVSLEELNPEDRAEG